MCTQGIYSVHSREDFYVLVSDSIYKHSPYLTLEIIIITFSIYNEKILAKEANDKVSIMPKTIEIG
jgi:hypothetical protein